MLFITRYAPSKISEVVGQQLAVSQLKSYVLNYKAQPQKAMLLWGPIGCGKTCSVYALAKELNYDLLEINSSDLRNQESIKQFLGSALGQQSLFFRPKIILIDEIDNISGVHDRGCLPAILKAIEYSSFPVIMTANDPFDHKFKELKKACALVSFQKLDYTLVAEFLTMICRKENISFEEKGINTLARQADGDVRAALLDLQVCGKKITFSDATSLSDRKRTASILQALAIIFKSSTAQNALTALENVDADLEETLFWIDHNLPQEYTDPLSLAKAYEWLSRADVFNGRIRNRQHWRFLAYINDLLTAGISSAKISRNKEFVKYLPTMRILRMWQAKMKNAKKKEIAEKLAKATHTSKKAALEQMPYLQQMFRSGGGSEMALELDLSEEEAEWLRKYS